MIINALSKFIRNLIKIGSEKGRIIPIFILSPPRAGSTLLFETMFNFKELYYLTHETDYVWWQLFPYNRADDPSDYVSGEEYSDCTCNEYLKLYLDGLKNSAMPHERQSKMYDCINANRSLRVLDKTIANCFHLDFIVKAFPDAQYIFLFRDPRDNISSMIEGWPYIDRFGKAQLNPLLQKHDDATISHWTYPAPPGWQEVVNRPLEEICAWSWQQHVIYMMEFIKYLDKSRYLIVKYEEMITGNAKVYEEIGNKFSLKMTSELYKAAENPKLSFTTVSAPQKDKWKFKNAEKIDSILPMIKSISSQIGYTL